MKMYTKKEVKIFRRVVKDYANVKKIIDKKVAQGYTWQRLYDYLWGKPCFQITNKYFGEDVSYIDFNYKDMCLSIYRDGYDDISGKIYLGDTIEVWNDEDLYYIDTFNNIKEIKNIIKKEDE